ncbi:MAG: glycosyltransferase [Flavobacteriales bacterium]|nr:glycosyltransferase [Flavobacteriales bacterium]
MKTSVALCTYNGERFIREQIDSILNQTQSVDEIVVCDDGSTDKTLDILEQYAIDNPNLFRIYKNEVNLRSVKNFEKAISLCSNEVIFLCDQDDKWESTKVKAFCSYFESHPEINVIASNGFYMDENSATAEKYSLWDIPEFLNNRSIPFDYFKIISYLGNLATGASMAVRREFVINIMPFPIIPGFHHDEWVALIAAHHNSFELISKKLFCYRIHKNQQVGGVFFKKNKRTERFFIHTYNLENEKLSLKSYKIILKKLIQAYEKNNKIIALNHKLSYIFKENSKAIITLYLNRKKNMRYYYPIQSRIVETIDKILNKRQFHP